MSGPLGGLTHTVYGRLSWLLVGFFQLMINKIFIISYETATKIKVVKLSRSGLTHQ